MAAETPEKLTAEQLQALFDILNHTETYREAESFKQKEAIREYGYPFSNAQPRLANMAPNYAHDSSSPLLQLFLTKCLLTIPNMSDLPADFWPIRFQSIMEQLADANLSESYDKGTLGTRKTLATGASVIHEAITRGLLSGVVKREDGERIDLKKATYDTNQAADLKAAWNDCVEDLIYGNLVDHLFDHAAQTRDFESHSPAVAAAGQYVIVYLAAFMHHIFVLSHKGQYLLKLIENVYKLVPFSMVRQTLRIGNAATMIRGMIRIFLAKMSVGGLTNWFRLTSGAADGMNLLQRIISLVLSWDACEFRKQASQTAPSKERPTKDQLAALQAYLAQTAEVHRAYREISTTQGKSIVSVILETADPKLATSVTDSQHTQCLEWLAAQLSARDRDEITRVVCCSHPDHLTAALRGAVATYDPLIRATHAGVDLREHVVSALETFMCDFIATTRPKMVKGSSGGNEWHSKEDSTTTVPLARSPSVEDYVALINRNKGLLYMYIHQIASNCVDLREQFRTWAHHVVGEFRQACAEPSGAGEVNEPLQDLYTALPADQKAAILARLDAHAAYLAELNRVSTKRMQRVLDSLQAKTLAGSERGISTANNMASSPSGSSGSRPNLAGPGVYLMRWDSLLDATLVTPATSGGGSLVRTGQDVKGLKAGGKTTAAGEKGGAGRAVGAVAEAEECSLPEAPDVSVVMEILGGGFRRLVNEKIRREGARSGLEKGGEKQRLAGETGAGKVTCVVGRHVVAE